MATTAAGTSFVIQPPEPFSFSSPNEWPKWKKRFQRFHTASGLSTNPEEHQIDALLYIMGDQAEDIFSTFQLTEAEAKKFDTIMGHFDAYFIPRRNVIFERARFNSRVQQEGESIEEFATSLHALSKYCDYGPMQDQFVRDRLVVGIRDKKLSAKLQLDADLTLQKALESARQVENVRQQQVELNQDIKAGSSVNKLDTRRTSTSRFSGSSAKSPGRLEHKCLVRPRQPARNVLSVDEHAIPESPV